MVECTCHVRAAAAAEEGGEMARFSVGREEGDNEGGPSSPRRTPVPKKRRTTDGVFSCSAVRREQEQEQEQEQEREPRCEIGEGVVEEVVEEEEEEEEEEVEEEEVEMYDQEEEAEEAEEAEEEEEEEEEVPGQWESDSDGYGNLPVGIFGLEGSIGNGSIPVAIPSENQEHGFVVSGGNGSISVTLSDPDVLDCPICLEPLCLPVFQCENGHVACPTCCIKIANKCPSCCWPIGYNRCRAIEKVLESVRVSCTYKIYGCKEILCYSKKTDHENACIYMPCACPFPVCEFVGTAAKVYAHFNDQHGSSAVHIFFNAVHPIYMEKDQPFQILQMRTGRILFIINHASDRLGSAVNIVCVGPPSLRRRFVYEIVATDGESSFKLESVAECIPSWSENCALKKFLFIPRDVLNSSGQLKLDVCIEEREYLFSGGGATTS